MPDPVIAAKEKTSREAGPLAERVGRRYWAWIVPL